MDPIVKELTEKRVQLVADSRKIIDAYSAEKRPPKAEEKTRLDAIYKEVDELKADIDNRVRQAGLEEELTERAGRRTKPGHPGTDEDPSGGVGGRIAGERLAREIGGRHRPDGSIRIGLWGRKSKITGQRRTPGSITLEPDSPLMARATATYRKAFAAYLQHGQISAGLQTSNDPKGGFLAPITYLTDIIKFVMDQVFMRQLATVLPPLTNAVSLGAPSLETDPNDADWTAEVPTSAISEDTAMTVGRRELTPHLITKLIKLSMKLLRASAIDVEGLVMERMAYKFAIAEEKGFLTGTGAQQPLGVFTASALGVPTSRDVACVGTTDFTPDEVIKCLYGLKAQYQARATGIFHRDFVSRLRQKKSGMGTYLWQPALTAGQPDLILNRPYVMSEYAPNTFTTGLYIGMFADFKSGYWIVDSLNMEVQRLQELFAATNQVGLLGRKETDGMPVLAEAFSRLKLA